jgi:hypothetical protein
MRINARLDEEHVRKLEALKQRRHLTTTEVVKKAIDYFYENEQEHPKGSLHALLESDFVGCFEDNQSTSENYKEVIGKYLDEKYPDR